MKRILFMIVPVVLILLAFRPTNSHEVSGKIIDNLSQPVTGATIQVKGTSTAVVSDGDGKFKITAPSSSSILVVSSVGYDAKEVKVNGRKEINVMLLPSQQQLEEVVVMGYSNQSAPLVAYAPGRVADRKLRVMHEMPLVDFNTEGYDAINETGFRKPVDHPLSTFSIDVDAASYSNVRRFLNSNTLPPAGAVRIEEMINYFSYNYPQPKNDDPFSINTEISQAPWNKDHRLVMIGLQGKKIPVDNLPSSNLVFLIDVSGSMNQPNKLPLVQASMKLLVDQLRPSDRVSIVVYAGAAGLVLKPTSGSNKIAIKEAIDRLTAGGSTAGGAGIRLAYKAARENFVKEGNNRVILCTDGDFNVGESSNASMEKLIEEERKSGIFLTVLGYGMGNYQDSKMQLLADKGNGNHAYIDGITEAKKVLVNEFGGTLFTIAKDVKLQVEFNPAKVQAYRLIGYENRLLNNEDFNDDQKDSGELGSGHTVTALYEIIPVGVKASFIKNVDPLKYQKGVQPLSKTNHTDELLTVKFRYKAPDGDVSKMIEQPLPDYDSKRGEASENLRFASAVAEFGMLLRNSEYKGQASYDQVLRIARKAKGKDQEGYRAEFVKLVETAMLLAGNNASPGEEDEGSW